MNATFSALLWCVVQVTVLGIGAAVIYLAARRIHPRAGAVAVGGALGIVLLLTALVASPWPRWSFSRSEAQVVDSERVAPRDTPVESAELDVAVVEEPSTATALPKAELESPQLAFWAALVEGLNNPRSAVEVQPEIVWWPRAIGLLFVVGAVIAAGRLACGVVSVRRLARRAVAIDDPRPRGIVIELQAKLGLSDSIALCESNELATPATVGWRRPIVMLPPAWRSWTEAELRAAVAHELAHVAGRDYAAWLVARLAVVAHFYHPLVRWLALRLQLEQELAADLAAARLVGDNRQYLHSLAALALATPPHRVAGPARTLIPSRSLLVRRLEMLRTSEMNRPRRNVVRYATFGIVALLGVAAAGLRGPGGEGGGVALAQTPEAERNDAKPVERIGLEVVPKDAAIVVSFRPADILSREELRKLPEFFSDLTEVLAEASLTPGNVAEILAMHYGDLAQSPYSDARMVVRFTTPTDQQKFLNSLLRKRRMKRLADAAVWRDGNSFVEELDPSTLVFDETPSPDGSARAPVINELPRWAEEWQSRNDDSVVAMVDVRSFLKNGLLNLNIERWAPLGEATFQMLYPLFINVDWAVAGLDLTDKVRLSGIVQSDQENADKVRDTLQAVFVMLRNMAGLGELATPQGPDGNPALPPEFALQKKLAEIASKLLASAKFEVKESRVSISLESKHTTKEIMDFALVMLPTVEDARQAARTTQNINNLKQLGVAMHNYHDTYKRFPPAVSYTYRKNGQVLKSEHPHSWRVALLPFLEGVHFYDQYRFDEPWDSEANLKVLAQMPGVLRSPFDETDSTNTSYFVFNGPGTMFEGEEGTQMRGILDGTTRTLMMVESKRPIPWTKPEDIPYDAEEPVPPLGGWVPGQFLAALADGSVRPISTEIDEATLRAWIGRADGKQSPELPRP